jgi:glycosyltransferase involved in cell wall biosynthesis
VSVVVPTKDGGALFGTTLASVIAQTMDDFELIVVDDASGDAVTADVIDAVRSDERVRLVSHSRSAGEARSRNEAMELARGRWVAFLDHDDLWAPTKLADQVTAMDGTGAPWSLTDALTIDGDGAITGAVDLPRHDMQAALFDGNWIVSSSALVDTALLRSVGGMNPTYQQVYDWDLWLRLLRRAEPVVVTERATAYRVHASMSLKWEGKQHDMLLLESEHAPVAREIGCDERAIRRAMLGWMATCAGRIGDRRLAASLLWQRTKLGRLPTVHDLAPMVVPDGASVGTSLRRRVRRNTVTRASAAWVAEVPSLEASLDQFAWRIASSARSANTDAA